MKQWPERPLSALDAIFVRRSVRAFAPDKLDHPTIRSLLDAAVQAPTAMHEEPWAFVVIEDAETLKRYSDRAKGHWAQVASTYQALHVGAAPQTEQAFARRFESPDFCLFYDAPSLIIICAKPLGPFVAADCWLAAENLMLAASALGLGTCCIGSAVPILNAPEIKAELHIPPEIEVVVPIVVGVPRETTESTRKDPEILYWKSSPPFAPPTND